MELSRRKGSVSEQPDSKTSEEEYELVRAASPLEALAQIFSERGIQSNVIVLASYSNPTKTLTPSRVYRALAKVIAEHPALSIIGVRQPSKKKEGHHRLWEARLSKIDLHRCVEFVQENLSNDEALAQLFERTHDKWLNNTTGLRPLWRLVIVNGTHALFVFHHLIADGTSGYAFHRSLLDALNESDIESGLQEESLKSVVTIVRSSDKPLEPHPLDQIEQKLSWLWILTAIVITSLLRFFSNRKYYFFADVQVTGQSAIGDEPIFVEQPTSTRIEILRIDQSIMKNCLVACREHKTSFTALLHTLIQVTLAADLYPEAKLGISSLSVSIRQYLRRDPGEDAFTDAVGVFMRAQFLESYRAAGSHSARKKEPTMQTDKANMEDEFPIIADQVWHLAAAYKSGTTAHTSSKGWLLQNFLSWNLFGSDDEEIIKAYNQGHHAQNSFVLSNKGVFRPKKHRKDSGWKIVDVALSGAAVRAKVCSMALGMYVATAEDGDCVVVASYEKDVLRDQVIRDLLKGIDRRLKALLRGKL